ncbi:prepilin-type N-terminal cleavage/methylation domain-containing protein [Patescibacteria group bacterium]|nr:prepilin-type N-terminal cleavage/methylation domain-containing protein [Patescibacteria group bacterium]
MRKKSYSKKGFSLVELLTVISIMAVLFGLGYANYRDFQRRQHLESAVRMVKADLRLAQEMALAGRKPAGCDLLNGYEFQLMNITGSYGDQYGIDALCDNNSYDYKTVILPENVGIRTFDSGNDFYFKVLGQGIDRTSNVTLTFRFSGSGVANRSIIITPVGEIR